MVLGASREPEPSSVRGLAGRGLQSPDGRRLTAEPLANLPFEYRLGQRYLYGEPAARRSSPTTRRTRERLYGVPEPQAVREGRLSPAHRQRGSGASTRTARHQSLHRITSRRSRPAARVVLRLRLTPEPSSRPAGGRRSHRRRNGARRQTSFTRRSIRPKRPRTSGASSARRSPAAVDQADLPVRREQVAGRRQPDCPPPASRQHDPQPALAAPELDAGAVDARQVGVSVVRRLGPGVPHASRSRSSIRSSPRSSSGCMLFEQFQHPNGQIPAYEWEFSDLNPPVHAWAVWRVYNMDRERTGKADREFLEKCFHKLLINFAWWVNKVDSDGKQRLRRRLPRARQHHGHRPQREAAGRRRAGAVRRHRLDGHVLPEPDADRPGAGQGEQGLRGAGHSNSSSTTSTSAAAMKHMGGPRLPALGRGGRLLLRRAALSRRQLSTSSASARWSA